MTTVNILQLNCLIDIFQLNTNHKANNSDNLIYIT
jgi:hypothetical protein